MSKKIALSSFSGVSPSTPNHSLPEMVASHAVNTRLTDSTIRPYYEPAISNDPNATMSTLASGYTNLFKTSREEAITWMAWSTEAHVTTLEVRYNDISAYDYPAFLESASQGGGVGGTLNVLFELTAGQVVFQNDEFVSSDTTIVFSSLPPEVDEFTGIAQTVVGYVTPESLVGKGNIILHTWTKISGDEGITIDDASIAAPTFTLDSLLAPSASGTYTSKEALYELKVDTDSLASGIKQIKIIYIYSWQLPLVGGGGTIVGDTIQNQHDAWAGAN